MSDLRKLVTDPDYLSAIQYHNSGNLSARILLHQNFSTGAQNWYEFVLDLAHVRSGERVLEIGCGNSMLWRGNHARLPENSVFYLSDLSPGMVRDGALMMKHDKRFHHLCLNGMAISFPDASFDLVIANHMLYHVPSVEQVLSEIRRVMKPGAHFLAATNGIDHMQDLDILLEKFSKRLKGRHGMGEKFNLQNGEKQLRSFFGKIQLHLYTSDLWVTDADILTEYAYSTPLVTEALGTEGRSQMRAFFQKRINRLGGIYIRKQTGVYLAQVDPGSTK